MGYARQVGFGLGDRVRQGQLLVELDSRDLDAQLRQAQEARLAAKEALPEADSAIASAKAGLELAQITHQRMEDLYKKASVSLQELDESSARLKSAQAAYEMAAARRRQVAARAAQAEAAVEAAVIMQGYSRVLAPFDGVVTDKRVEPGNLATPGAPLAVVERDGEYRLEASVDESRLRQTRAGQEVSVVLDALGEKVAARVSEVVPVVDAASRSGTVRINLAPMPQLRSGLFGRALFSEGKRSVLAVPGTAVREQGQLRMVFVVRDGVARTRMVSLGDAREGWVEALSGLDAGEKVVLSVPPGLADGARVEVRQ
jgi:multidrug efflux pump subunit AcrA (membrane-fusion protein)